MLKPMTQPLVFYHQERLEGSLQSNLSRLFTKVCNESLVEIKFKLSRKICAPLAKMCTSWRTSKYSLKPIYK